MMQNFATKKPFNRLVSKSGIQWTAHSRSKMNFYRLTEGRIRRIINSPERVEYGIAPKTIAVMQTNKGPKNSYEIWAMVQDDKTGRKVISAWRYPGKTKPGESLPAQILREFRSGLHGI